LLRGDNRVCKTMCNIESSFTWQREYWIKFFISGVRLLRHDLVRGKASWVQRRNHFLQTVCQSVHHLSCGRSAFRDPAVELTARPRMGLIRWVRALARTKVWEVDLSGRTRSACV
jgi:hypothetical protein